MKIVVPYDSLRPQTLQALLEEFVTRDGAVHGHTETPLDEQIAAVRALLVSGKVVIVFDQAEGSCTVAHADQFRDAPPSDDDV